MENIHNAVEDPKDKKLLKDGDGIGTPATRAAIITELKRKGYLETTGKQIHATALGQQLLTVVPPLIKNPALTARFERVLKQVENKEVLLEQFLEIQKKFIRQEIASLFKKE
jgi:DNA topoisomerase-3